MSLKQRLEEHVVLVLLGTAAVSFGAGFGAYETILRVSNQTTISQIQKIDLERAAARTQELEAALKKATGVQGGPPKSGNFILTSKLDEGRPVDTLRAATIGTTPVLFVRWVGLTPGGVYSQSWEVRDNNGRVMDQFDYPFVPPGAIYDTWRAIYIDPTFYAPGNYRVQLMLNGEQGLEAGFVVEPADESAVR